MDAAIAERMLVSVISLILFLSGAGRFGSGCIGAFCDPTGKQHSCAAHSPDNDLGPNGRSREADQSLHFFGQNLLDHGFVERQIGNEAVGLLVLLLELAHLAQI